MRIGKRRVVALALASLVAVMVSAATWEGSAMIGTYGDFPSSGYFAACNSFARNTAVEVVNLENGRSVTVIVTRTIDAPGVFMMLSIEAASALGLQQGRVARVRASEPRSATELAPKPKAGASFDPDLNPRVLAAEELRRMGYELSTSGPAISKPMASAGGAQVIEVPAPKEGAKAPLIAQAEPKPPAPAAVAAPAPTTSPAAAVAPIAPAPVPTTAPVTAAPPTATATPAPTRPSAVALTPPKGAVVEPAGVAVAEPSPVFSGKPMPVAGAKPKPVRTILLPELPEPPAPPKAVAKPIPAPAAPAPLPEAIASALPVPDETPIRVSPQETPKRYEAPAMRPEVSERGPKPPLEAPPALALGDPEPEAAAAAAALAFTIGAPSPLEEAALAELGVPVAPGRQSASALTRSAPSAAGESEMISLAEPATPGRETAGAVTRTVPAAAGGIDGVALADPATPVGHKAVAYSRSEPRKAGSTPGPELAWPEIEADEIPEIVLSGLSAPVSEIPATSLAEGEFALPAIIGPKALALETPAFGAAVTEVALAEAEAEPEETPTVEALAGLYPDTYALLAELAEAERKPDEVPTIVDAAGLSPSAEAEGVSLAEAERKPDEKPDVVESSTLAPSESGAEVALAEAERAEAASPKPETSPGLSPVVGEPVPLAQASEHKPDTAPIVAAPEAKPAETSALHAPAEYIVAIEPTGPKPPAAAEPAKAPTSAVAAAATPTAPTKPAAAITVPSAASAPARDGILRTTSLEKGKFYIQIGAFGSESTARDAISSLGTKFVTVVEKVSSKGKDTWRVFVGPLSRDESGLALVTVRAMGFKDAFVKSGG